MLGVEKRHSGSRPWAEVEPNGGHRSQSARSYCGEPTSAGIGASGEVVVTDTSQSCSGTIGPGIECSTSKVPAADMAYCPWNVRNRLLSLLCVVHHS